jgi:hypothetical protein
MSRTVGQQGIESSGRLVLIAVIEGQQHGVKLTCQRNERREM